MSQQDSPPPESPEPASSLPLLAGVLGLLCLLIREQGVMALPIFGDESIYLRWADLVRAGHWWVSLVDPKPPLHFWLMAGLLPMWGDPLGAARFLSVLAGVLSVVALIYAAVEVAGLLRERAGRLALPSGRVWGLIAALLMIFSPFFSFYQRLATADSLFVLEMLAAVCLALRWGRVLGSGRRVWPTTLGLGVVLGAGLLTRQGLSYTLFGLPVVAFWLHAGRLGGGRGFRGAVHFGVVIVIALGMWSPYLAADLGAYTREARVEAAAEGRTATGWTVVKQRIFYQDHFTAGTESPVERAGKNFHAMFVPGWDGAKGNEVGLPNSGFLYFYLTPAVYLAALLGLPLLVIRRQFRVLIFVGAWLVFMIGPLFVLNVLYSRYLLAGATPLLLLAAYTLTELFSALFSLRISAFAAWSATSVVLVGVVLIPIQQIGLQGTRWWEQKLTGRDRYQYVTGWTAGLATQRAIRFIQHVAKDGPLVVITDDGWGTPADALWVYLGRTPNVTVYYTSRSGEGPVLTAGAEPHTFMLRKDKWLYTPAEPVNIPPTVQVLYVANQPGPGTEFEERLRRLNPNLGTGIPFYGIDEREDQVMLFQVQ